MTNEIKPDPAKNEPAKTEPAKAEPAKSEAAVRSDGAKSEAPRPRPRSTTKGGGRRSRVTMRNLQIEDFERLRSAMEITYRGTGLDPWGYEQIKRLLQDFPEGQICVEVNGKVAGAALSLTVKYSDYGDDHNYQQITGQGQLNTHNPKGDTLYGIEVFVHPDFRGLRLGRRLYDARKELCENLNLRKIVIGGRIPGYKNHAAMLRPGEYIEKVRLKEIYDPILTFQLSNQFHVTKLLTNYLSQDQESLEYAVLMEWNNIYYTEKAPSLFNAKKSNVRLGLVQWQMRRADTVEELFEQIEFFVDAVSSFQADFAVFPEFINAPLMVGFNHMGEAQAIRQLSEFTDPLLRRFLDLAVEYNCNIITGSMPILEEGKLHSVCFLCRRDGSWGSYRKVHISIPEVNFWGMTGGDEIPVFDTDCGRVAIMISDDIQYPELGRLYAEQNVDIMFVPFSSSTQNEYQRVKCCAQARAIENECYVAIAGCVGNLPKVANMDMQFAQSAVYSPSDFSFPTDSTIAEATPNTEMTLIADINLELLKEVHNYGTARNLLDRRKDLYSVQWHPVRITSETPSGS